MCQRPLATLGQARCAVLGSVIVHREYRFGSRPRTGKSEFWSIQALQTWSSSKRPSGAELGLQIFRCSSSLFLACQPTKSKTSPLAILMTNWKTRKAHGWLPGFVSHSSDSQKGRLQKRFGWFPVSFQLKHPLG